VTVGHADGASGLGGAGGGADGLGGAGGGADGVGGAGEGGDGLGGAGGPTSMASCPFFAASTARDTATATCLDPAVSTSPRGSTPRARVIATCPTVNGSTAGVHCPAHRGEHSTFWSSWWYHVAAVADTCAMDTHAMDACAMDTCAMDACAMDTCAMDACAMDAAREAA
jgi:hypothetical protein